MRSNHTKPIIPSVDYILWWPCSMHCQYCFATFKDQKPAYLIKNQLKKEESLELVEKIASQGFKKITFLGGEPTLCPWLNCLVKTAKQKGLITIIATNGSLITEDYLDRFEDSLDWITLSIDSLDPNKLIKIGRTVGSTPISRDKYLDIIQSIKKKKIKLKINTVVSKLTWRENMLDFILKAQPLRWKILQVLRMKGQNDNSIDRFLITNKQLQYFVNKHKKVELSGINVTIVNNDVMPGSYILIDPTGRFIDTSNGKYIYSDPILKIGIDRALKQIRVEKNKFYKRGGVYQW